jgi:hypothetical protein
MSYKTINGYPNYMIDTQGNIKNIKGRYIKPRYDKRGYLRVNLSNNGKKGTYFVHQLVMQTFNGLGNKYASIDHIDGNKENNHIDNLRYVSLGENIELSILKRNDELSFYLRELQEIYSDDELSEIFANLLKLTKSIRRTGNDSK